MRMALKNTLALTALYLLVVTGLAFMIEAELRDSVREVMNQTAKLVGSEVAAALHAPAVQHLLGKTRDGERRLAKIIASAKDRSDTLVSIEVVNAQGRVVAGDDRRARGRSRPPPNAMFQDNLEPVLLSEYERRFHEGKHVLATPLTRNDELLGYISIGLSDRGTTALYNHVYSTLLVAALAGLGAILALGVLLQLQLRRLGASLAALVEAVAQGDAEGLADGRDEFPEVRYAAHRLGNALKAARGQASLAEAKLNAVANVFEVGVILINPEGLPEYINEPAKRILVGDRPEEFEAKFQELRAALNEAMERLRQPDGVVSRQHIEINDAAGVTRRLRAELHALGTGEHRGYLLIIKDRDLLDALDEDLRAATRARSLSRLHAAAAHDLKAPLNAMSLQLDLLRRSLETADDAVSRSRRQHYIDVLHQEMQRLNRLLHSVLSQDTPATEGRAAVDLRQVLDELITLLIPQARHQRVQLELELPEQPVPVFVNIGQLKQALLNVILNALECVPAGGRVDVHLRVDCSTALVAVRDSGPGIPAALLTSIFDMHFTTKNTGTGIGLYVARAVAEGHGGEIHVESKLGEGSCFTISLPLARANRDASPKTLGAAERGG
jgi:signal transduction histidine kinase